MREKVKGVPIAECFIGLLGKDGGPIGENDLIAFRNEGFIEGVKDSWNTNSQIAAVVDTTNCIPISARTLISTALLRGDRAVIREVDALNLEENERRDAIIYLRNELVMQTATFINTLPVVGQRGKDCRKCSNINCPDRVKRAGLLDDDDYYDEQP